MKSLTVLLIALGGVMAGIRFNGDPHHTSEVLLGMHGSARLLEGVGENKESPEEEKNPEFWHAVALGELAKRVEESYNYNKAKNVIFFLGDGMSLSTVAAARMRKGQLQGRTGEEEKLSFEKFPHTGLSRTYCANAQVADSACTSTAYQCGVKANIVTLGVPANVEYNNCTQSMNPDNHLTSIADWAQKAGKSTGFITTTTLTHASPTGMYGKVASRFWECDADIPDEIRAEGPCMDLAQQLVKRAPGRNLDLVMGGGMGKFVPNTITDAHGNPGERQDGQNLLELWQEMHPTGAIVTDRDSLLNLDVNKVSNIMGLFNSAIMDFHSIADPAEKPTLAEMTEVALKFMSRNKKGYYIFIEGGLIDYGNHFNRPYISTDEALEMDKAIEVALSLTDPNETLIVVSSDHAHPLTISGYPRRGNDILGLNQDDRDDYGDKYATLNYAVGLNQYMAGMESKHEDLEMLLANEADFLAPSEVPADIGVHAGDDVGIFAHGAHSHLFRGVMQQHTLPHLMAYAACIGEGRTACDA